MARSFAGGTDRLKWTVPAAVTGASGCFAFRMKTTQTTTNALPISYWDTNSRNGFGFILNNTANKLLVQAWSFSATRVSLLSTSNLNDGNWHQVAFNYNEASGGANALFIDGTQEASGNASGSWGINANTIINAGGFDTFWPSYVGEIAEVGHWSAQLGAAEIAALASGFSPGRIRPASLLFHAPIIRGTNDRFGLVPTVTGGSVSDHPRLLGAVV